jgi:transketolase C-terminal domain/subunit
MGILPATDEEAEDILMALEAATALRDRLGVDVAVMQDLSVKPLSHVRYLEEGPPLEIIIHP